MSTGSSGSPSELIEETLEARQSPTTSSVRADTDSSDTWLVRPPSSLSATLQDKLLEEVFAYSTGTAYTLLP